MLGLLRVFPILHCQMPEDYIPLSQQFWALLLELEKHLVNKRREQSLLSVWHLKNLNYLALKT